jgi:hypothetical protein
VSSAALGRTFARVRAAAAHLPEVEEGTSYGTPSLKVRGKSLARMKGAETLVVMCAIDEKEMLMEVDAGAYFETDHYKGWPAVLVRLKKISDAKLRYTLEQAWRLKAPKRLIATVDSGSLEARSLQKRKKPTLRIGRVGFSKPALPPGTGPSNQ